MFAIRLRLTVHLVAGLALWASPPAQAQVPASYLDQPSEDVVRDVFSGEYGKLLIAEFGKILNASADKGCLESKGLAPGQLADRGEKLLIRYGAQMLDIFRDTLDMGKYATLFGAGAKSEVEKLLRDPEVNKLVLLDLPGRRSRLANVVIDYFDRFVVLNRIKLSANLSPLATGNDDLLNADPAEKSADAVDEFISKSTSPQVARYVVLAEMSQQALNDAMNRDKVILIGPTQMFRGADQALAELCVPAGR